MFNPSISNKNAQVVNHESSGLGILQTKESRKKSSFTFTFRSEIKLIPRRLGEAPLENVNTDMGLSA